MSINRLKELLSNREIREVDDPRPIPDNAHPCSLPLPAVQMMDSVLHIITTAPAHPEDMTQEDLCKLGAMLTNVMVKAAAAIEMVKAMHNRMDGPGHDSF